MYVRDTTRAPTDQNLSEKCDLPYITNLHAHLIGRLAAIHRWNPKEEVSRSRQ